MINTIVTVCRSCRSTVEREDADAYYDNKRYDNKKGMNNHTSRYII